MSYLHHQGLQDAKWPVPAVLGTTVHRESTFTLELCPRCGPFHHTGLPKTISSCRLELGRKSLSHPTRIFTTWTFLSHHKSGQKVNLKNCSVAKIWRKKSYWVYQNWFFLTFCKNFLLKVTCRFEIYNWFCFENVEMGCLSNFETFYSKCFWSGKFIKTDTFSRTVLASTNQYIFFFPNGENVSLQMSWPALLGTKP